MHGFKNVFLNQVNENLQYHMHWSYHGRYSKVCMTLESPRKPCKNMHTPHGRRRQETSKMPKIIAIKYLAIILEFACACCCIKGGHAISNIASFNKRLEIREG